MSISTRDVNGENEVAKKASLHYVYGKILDLIFEMFWMYQANNFTVYEQNNKFYRFQRVMCGVPENNLHIYDICRKCRLNEEYRRY